MPAGKTVPGGAAICRMYTVGSTGFWLKTNLLAEFQFIFPGFWPYPQVWYAAYTFIGGSGGNNVAAKKKGGGPPRRHQMGHYR